MNPEEYLESIGYVFEKDYEELYKEEYVEELKLKELLELLENYHQQKLSEITDDAIKDGIDENFRMKTVNGDSWPDSNNYSRNQGAKWLLNKLKNE